MLNPKKIKYLESGWKPNKPPSRDTSVNGLKQSMSWFKKEVENYKKQLNKKLSDNDWVECDYYCKLLIRRAQKLYTEKQFSKQYVEKHNDDARKHEHLIPLGISATAYMQNHIPFEILLGLPCVDISRESDSAYLKGEWKDNTPSWSLPFKRYKVAGVPEKIYAGDIKIPFNTWTLKDHFDIFPPIKI